MNIKILDSWLREYLKTSATPKKIAEIGPRVMPVQVPQLREMIIKFPCREMEYPMQHVPSGGRSKSS